MISVIPPPILTIRAEFFCGGGAKSCAYVFEAMDVAAKNNAVIDRNEGRNSDRNDEHDGNSTINRCRAYVVLSSGFSLESVSCRFRVAIFDISLPLNQQKSRPLMCWVGRADRPDKALVVA
jgi:hypothetical protein